MPNPVYPVKDLQIATHKTETLSYIKVRISEGCSGSSLVDLYSGNSLKWLPGGLNIQHFRGECPQTPLEWSWQSRQPLLAPHSKTSSAAPTYTHSLK